jgi:hypothetical protein
VMFYHFCSIIHHTLIHCQADLQGVSIYYVIAKVHALSSIVSMNFVLIDFFLLVCGL